MSRSTLAGLVYLLAFAIPVAAVIAATAGTLPGTPLVFAIAGGLFVLFVFLAVAVQQVRD